MSSASPATRRYRCRFASWLVALLAALAGVVAAPAVNAQDESPWSAGAARINITPDRSMWMAGYAARREPARGKLNELWAKALVLEHANGERGLLITLDLIGIDRELAERVCSGLAEAYGFRRDQIMLCTSHTHSGPVVSRNLGPLHYWILEPDQQQLVDLYAEALPGKILEVARLALLDHSPAELRWGSGRATFAVNRRNNPAAEVPERRAQGTLEGPFDHDVPVLAVYRPDGTLRAVTFGYACHATVLSGLDWCGDYPGYAQREWERRHPECVALFWAGCGGDQNPLPRRSVDLAREYGTQLADAVDRVLESDMEPVEGPFITSYTVTDLPLATLPTREDVERDTTSENRYTAARARNLLTLWERDGGLAPTYPYPIGLWQLGDVQWVFLGGEVVVDYALRLKQEGTGTRTWVAGYANDVMAYIPSRRVLREGGYEGGGAMVYYGLPTVWSERIENQIIEEVQNLVR